MSLEPEAEAFLAAAAPAAAATAPPPLAAIQLETELLEQGCMLH